MNGIGYFVVQEIWNREGMFLQHPIYSIIAFSESEEKAKYLADRGNAETGQRLIVIRTPVVFDSKHLKGV